ncbi:MAG: hypothetical protein AAGH99_02450 [Planctomycetota bacterium]
MTVAEEVEAPVEPDLKGAERAEAEGVDKPGRASLPIAFDLACMGCQYNLRTLHAEAVCPECGQPVAETLAAFRRGWRREDIVLWRKGCKWVGISGLLTAASPVIVLAVLFLGSFFLGSFEGVGLSIVVGLFVLAEHFLWVRGTWRLTAGHPGAERATPWLIQVLRISVVVHGLFALASVVLPLTLLVNDMMRSGYRDDGVLWVMWGFVVTGTVTARAVVTGGLMRLLTQTLGVAGHLWKRRHLLVTGTVVIILCVAQATATLATMSDRFISGGAWTEYGMVVGSGSIFALPVIAIWSAVSVFRAGVAFKLPKD